MGKKIMIEIKNFVECLKDSDVEFFTGVPDSLLKSFCAYVGSRMYGLIRSDCRKRQSPFRRC